MKNVLIPTDFSAQSLQLVNKTAEALKGEKFNIVLFHAFNMPDSITDLMFLGRERIYKGLVTDDFRNQCKKLKNLYFDTINSICVKYMYGSTLRVFRNFADANDIDLVVLPKDLILQLPHKYSIDPAYFLRKSGITLLDSFDTSQGKVSVIKRGMQGSYNLTKI